MFGEYHPGEEGRIEGCRVSTFAHPAAEGFCFEVMMILGTAHDEHVFGVESFRRGV